MSRDENYIGISEAALRLGVRPRDLTDGFYNRRFDVEKCPVLAGRRLIPESYLWSIALELRRMGRQVKELATA